MPKDAIEVSSPVISPDGRTLVFAATSHGKRSLYLRSLASLEAQPLPGTDEASAPFWSPDNRFIGFFANNKLKKIDVSGGPAQTLCDAPSAFGGTWNADGVILISLDIKGINRVSASGGTQHRFSGLMSRVRSSLKPGHCFCPTVDIFCIRVGPAVQRTVLFGWRRWTGAIASCY